MIKFEKFKWIDHVVDKNIGVVLQQGTELSAERFNRLEEAIEACVSECNKMAEIMEKMSVSQNSDNAEETDE